MKVLCGSAVVGEPLKERRRRSVVTKKPAFCGLLCWCICIYVHLGACICIVSMYMYMCACACAILFMHVHIRTCKSVLEFVCGSDVLYVLEVITCIAICCRLRGFAFKHRRSVFCDITGKLFG